MNKTIFWVAITGVLITTLVFITDIWVPFFIAFVISYILQPIIDCILLRYQLSRSIVASVVFIICVSIFIIVIVILLPIIYQQVALLISKIPIYRHYLQTKLIPIIMAKIYSMDQEMANRIKDYISHFINSLFSIVTGFTHNLWYYTIVTVNLFIFILLMPVILFYFLRDWPKMIMNIKLLLPLKSKNKIEEIFSSINKLLFAYIGGQLNICLLLSVFYGISLSIIGVDLGLLLGILSGFLIIIPFIGILISFSLTIIISYCAFGMTIKLAYILITYLIGHIVEAYILAPQIISNKIGLHPLWIMFAVLLCGSLFGFVGIFFAIPIAGIVKILLLSLVEYYKSSKLYNN